MRLRSRVRKCVVPKVDEKLIVKAKKNKQKNRQGKKILKKLHEDVNEKNDRKTRSEKYERKSRNEKNERKGRNEKTLTPITNDRSSKYFTPHKYERKTSNSRSAKTKSRSAKTKSRSAKTKRLGLLTKRFPADVTGDKCTARIEKLKLGKKVKSIMFEKKQLNNCGDLPRVTRSNCHEVIESTPLEKLPLRTKSSKKTQKVLINNLSGVHLSSNSQISKKSDKYNEGRSSQRNCYHRKKLQQVHHSENVIKDDKLNTSSRKTKSKQKGNRNLLERYLSSTLDFTLIKCKKKETHVQLQGQSWNTERLYTQVCYDNLNKTEMFHQKGKKKLYTRKQEMFAVSPREVKSKSILPNSIYESSKSKESKTKHMDVTLKPPIGDGIEIDMDKENKAFSIVQCDKEISFRIDTSSIENFLDSNVDNELVVSKEVLESIIDKDEDRTKKCNNIMISNDLHIMPLKERGHKIENEVKNHFPSTKICNENRTISKSGKLHHKKKRLLHSKGTKVFDLECNYNEENMLDKINMTSNKNIMKSVLHFM